MQTINCYIPLKLRLRGEPSEDDWANLEEAVVARYRRTLRGSLVEVRKPGFIEPRMLENVREPFAAERVGQEEYLIPSYRNGEPKQIPLRKHHKKSMDCKFNISTNGYWPYPQEVLNMKPYALTLQYLRRSRRGEADIR